MPTFFNITIMIKYKAIMTIKDIPREKKNEIFFFNKTGNNIKKLNEGNTIQKIP